MNNKYTYMGLVNSVRGCKNPLDAVKKSFVGFLHMDLIDREQILRFIQDQHFKDRSKEFAKQQNINNKKYDFMYDIATKLLSTDMVGVRQTPHKTKVLVGAFLFNQQYRLV